MSIRISVDAGARDRSDAFSGKRVTQPYRKDPPWQRSFGHRRAKWTGQTKPGRDLRLVCGDPTAANVKSKLC
ncbi:MAG: hypothetical protein CMJ59_10115 [Planctomycetaceae bacterium]|nr:hypothetical protein [Planctomycetaceae bacterium]